MNIGSYAFEGCGNLKDVYFEGSQKQWNAIVTGNESLTGAVVHFRLLAVWLNEDGTQLYEKAFWSGENAPEAGTYASTPAKPGEQMAGYSFAGWLKSGDSEGNITYTASYRRNAAAENQLDGLPKPAYRRREDTERAVRHRCADRRWQRTAYQRPAAGIGRNL